MLQAQAMEFTLNIIYSLEKQYIFEACFFPTNVSVVLCSGFDVNLCFRFTPRNAIILLPFVRQSKYPMKTPEVIPCLSVFFFFLTLPTPFSSRVYWDFVSSNISVVHIVDSLQNGGGILTKTNTLWKQIEMNKNKGRKGKRKRERKRESGREREGEEKEKER